LVETQSGLTKGTVVNISEDGNLDILGTTGNRYRNCMPFMWRPQSLAPASNAPTPLRRGDICHIVYNWQGVYFQRNGWVISCQTSQVFVMFEDLDSAWIKREWVAAGHGDNPM